MVSLSSETGAPSLGEQAREQEARLREAALQHPLVRAALETFPGAKLVARRERASRAGEAGRDQAGDPDRGDGGA